MDFELFLRSFVPQAASKSKRLNQIAWILETTGSSDAAALRAELDLDLRTLFSDPDTYKKLSELNKNASNYDLILRRQLSVLLRAFKQNLIPPSLLEETARQESDLLCTYANFRPSLRGKELSENEIRELLKNENSPDLRKQVWEASKQIGAKLAPSIISLVKLRNQAAESLGYENYFQMQLELQEVNEVDLFALLDEVAVSSDKAYAAVVEEIESKQSERFKVAANELGPWAWSEPFCQEDPTDARELDELVAGVDIVRVGAEFYRDMGCDVEAILKSSDLFERPGKNQHAFCINMDRGSDVRTLNNIKPSIKWLETLLHELGHAVYELGFDSSLPWLLREPPHMITTEAMALIAGRQAYRKEELLKLVDSVGSNDPLLDKAEESLRRRQLIFSRWVLVMTYFERELYRNPDQDLNALWWHLVKTYQKIRPPAGREETHDWAAKYHIGLAPVYYYSYLLGELFASAIEEVLKKKTGTNSIRSKEAGDFLRERLFAPGNRLNWQSLIKHVTDEPLSAGAWLQQFSL